MRSVENIQVKDLITLLARVRADWHAAAANPG